MPSRRSSSSKNSAPPTNGAASRNGHARRNGSSNGNGHVTTVTVLPSHHDKAERQALLRNHAGPRADRMVVLYGDSVPVFELSGRGRSFFNGLWDASITIDGRVIPLEGTWENLCWHADEDADYLELRCTVEPGLRVERLFMLARRAQLAVLADSIVTTEARQIGYQARFSLAPKIRCRSDRATRECRLVSGASSARVFPLALPQDRVLSCSGALTSAGRELELTQVGSGNALFVPLLIDWDPKRSRAAADWRNLTVAEALRTVAPAAAAGFRLRLGRAQWLVYHSLHHSGHGRSVLGYHTHHETVIGEFTPAGTVKPFIEIESETAG